MTEEVKKVPARYIGDREVILSPERGPYFDVQGQPLQPLLRNANTGLPVHGLRQGDTLMMPDVEILGSTYFVADRNTGRTLFLGAGKRILPEHQGLSYDELVQKGYEFSEGRPDFEVVEPTMPASEKPLEAPVMPEHINATPVQPEPSLDVPSAIDEEV
jgi:hypothetical protein